MSITLDLPPETEKALTDQAAARGLSLAEYVERLAADSEPHLPRNMEELWERVLLAPGESNGLADIVGKWPGDETDEEVAAALAELS